MFGTYFAANERILLIGFIVVCLDTVVLISPYPDQEGNKLMFLSEWRKFPSTPCLAGKQT